MTAPFDPYRALGVRRDASDAEIKAAHRRLAKRFHPDAGGDHERFLRVQEAYRLLSDPLLRRDWDAKHAPGPLRADVSGAPRRTRGAGRRAAETASPAAGSSESASNAASAGDAASADDPLRRPRSRRAYTWSASEVPWWEEGVSENRRQPGRKRPARPATRREQAASAPSNTPPPPDVPPEAPNAFDVYNRSSGAAWSMAARAYFRRGDQELPRRGQFHYEGTQVLTGARARTAADAEARRRAQGRTTTRPQAAAASRSATATPAAGAAANTAPPRTFRYSAGVARDARRIHEVREAWRRRSNATSWPSLGERLIFALVAWAPIAVLIGIGGAAVTGCADASPRCPAYLETAQALGIALSLGLLVALPKVAYVGALATVGALFAGLGIVGLISFMGGVNAPLNTETSAGVVLALLGGYVVSAAVVLLRDREKRPWHAGAKP